MAAVTPIRSDGGLEDRPKKVYTVGTIVALVQYAVAGAAGAYVHTEMQRTGRARSRLPS